MIEPNSRYRDTPLLTFRTDAGDPVRYLARRFPSRVQAPLSLTVRIQASDRPDLLAARVFGDPLAFWRIAEANRILDPWALTATVGAQIRMPPASALFTVGE